MSAIRAQVNALNMIGEEMPVPNFLELLEKMKTIHELKNEDYSSGGPFENFERTATISSWFSTPMDRAFTNHIGNKLARLATLLDKKTTPNNESIEDSFLDLCTYCALWASYHKSNPVESDGKIVQILKNTPETDLEAILRSYPR